MPTVAAGASATITLPAGRTFTDSGGSGWVTVFGPGQSAGQTYALLNNGALGPYAEDRSIYIAAQQAVEYSVDGPPSPVGVLPSGQMVNLDTLSPVSGGGSASPENRIVLFGDSRTQFNNTVNSNATQTYSQGYWTWANIFLGEKRLWVEANHGVGGDTTAMMIARLPAVLATTAPWVCVWGGINDLAGLLLDLPAVQTNMATILDALSGRRIILIGETPVTTAHGSFSRRLMARIIKYNHWLRQQARTRPNITFIDSWSVIVDPTSADSAPRAGYFADTTHLGQSGAMVHGAEIARVIGPMISESGFLVSSDSDRVTVPAATLTSLTGDGVTATAAITTHGYKIGDPIKLTGATPAGYNGQWTAASIPDGSTITFACTAASGAATGTISATPGTQLLANPLFLNPTAGLAAGWTQTNTGCTTVNTNTARADGLGNWQQVAVTFSGAGNSLLQGGDYVADVFAGDKLRFAVEFEIDAGHTVLEGISFNLNCIVGGVTYTPIANYRLSGVAITGAGSLAGVLVYEPDFTVPAGAVTRVRPQVVVYGTAAGAITVRWGRGMLRKVLEA